MIVFEVENSATNSKSGISDKTGKPWQMHFQQVLIHGISVDGFPSRFPRESTIQLDDGQQPYAPGKYVIASDCFYFGDFGRFTMGRLKLMPLPLFLADLQNEYKKAA